MSSPDSEFEHDTGVRRTGEGEYAADLTAGWGVGGGLNGGYLMATLGTAIAEATRPHGHPDPLALSGYFLSAARPGPATARVEVLRAGRGSSTVRAGLVQQEEDGTEAERLAVLASYADLGALEDEVATTASAPDLPPVEDCLLTSDAPGAPPISHRMELRLDPACLGWTRGEPSGRAVMQGWVRLADRELDALALLFVVDALPPTLFDLGRPGWAPTVELSAHVRARPAPGWAIVRHETRNLAGGFFEEDCEVWDSTGRLVAQARQLAKTPRAPADR